MVHPGLGEGGWKNERGGRDLLNLKWILQVPSKTEGQKMVRHDPRSCSLAEGEEDKKGKTGKKGQEEGSMCGIRSRLNEARL